MTFRAVTVCQIMVESTHIDVSSLAVYSYAVNHMRSCFCVLAKSSLRMQNALDIAHQRVRI